MDLSSFTLRELKKSDIDAFDDLYRYAFQVTDREMERSGWTNRLMKHSNIPVFEQSYVLGWFFEGHLASQIVVYPMNVNIEGKIFSMGGVTGVATYPEYTGHGLMHRLIKKSLEHMRLANQTISFLYPYSIPFYRKQGWEVVSDKLTFSLKDTQLPRHAEVSGFVRRVKCEESEDLRRVWKYYAIQHHGALLRGPLEWQEYWRWETDDIMGAIYYSDENKPLGYIAYYIADDIFRIKEMVALNMEARNGLWNFIAAHFSMVDRVEGDNYSGEPISFQFDDPEITETIEPYIMARIVDVQKFLHKYPFRLSGKHDHFWLEVSDSTAEWNNGVFEVGLNEKRRQFCKKVMKQDADPTRLIRLNIQTLTAMLLGYKRPEYLYNNERIHMNYNFLKELEMSVPAGKPYFSDYF